MSYRKIEVDGKTYEYVIGRKFVKFRHDRKPIPVSEIGVPWRISRPTRFGRIATDEKSTYITPKFIAAFLRGNPIKSHVCEKHKFTCTEMVSAPFAYEIYDKRVPMWNCPECVQQNAWNI